MHSIVLEFDQIRKSYGEIQAVKDLSFSVYRGEIFGFIGPNGAGKTTTIKILVGLLKDYHGNIRINGENINKESMGNKNLGYLPQECDFQEWRTVQMALSTFGRLSGLSKEEVNSRIPEVLAQVGLNDVENRKIKNLSGGMKQKLRLAQALLHSPPILILDEPMTGLDPASRFQMKQIIKELAKKEITILLSSHILSDIEDIADRIGILNKGVLLQIGTTEQLQKKFQVDNRVKIKTLLPIEDASFFSSLEEVESFDQTKPNQVIVTVSATHDIASSLRHLNQVCIGHELTISHFELLQPNLEQVYMQLVGGTSK